MVQEIRYSYPELNFHKKYYSFFLKIYKFPKAFFLIIPRSGGPVSSILEGL
jgi:hypothetical protein